MSRSDSAQRRRPLSPLWLLQAGGIVNAVGDGLVLPFLVIYLHDSRGIGLSMAGLILAAGAAATLFVSPIVGTLADFFDPRLVLAAALVLTAAALSILPLITTTWQAFAVIALLGAGEAGFRTGQSTLIASFATSATAGRSFAVQRLVRNVGIGGGAALAGVVLASGGIGRFRTTFLADAACTLVFAVAALGLPQEQRRLNKRTRSGGGGGFRAVYDHRLARSLLLINVVFVAAGYGQFELLPVYAKNTVGIGSTAIGVAFLVNSLVVAVAQLPMVAAIGRKPLQALLLMGALWAMAWTAVMIAGVFTTAGFALILTAVGLFALGECIHPVQTAFLADIAPAPLRGRYMASMTASFQLGLLVGPALGGIILAHVPIALWPIAGIATLGAGGASSRLRRLASPLRREAASQE